MEQNEILSAWKELNEKINTNSLVNKDVLKNILENRRKTALQKLIIADRTGMIFFFLLTIGIGSYLFLESNQFIVLNIQAVALLLISAMMNAISYFKLMKVSFDDAILVLYRKIASYKKVTLWNYLISYILVTIFIISFLYSFPWARAIKISLILIMPVCVVIDCFLYHWTSTKLTSMIETTKELKELNELE